MKEPSIPYVIRYPLGKGKGKQDVNILPKHGEIIDIDTYQPEFAGEYFCPACGVPCVRRPKHKEIETRRRRPYFAHHENTKTSLVHYARKKAWG